MKGRIFEFGPFQLDAAQQQLRRRGIRLRLPSSRIRLLLLFIARRGELITRDEIAGCLWKDAQNVDVMSGINTAVNQLRTQLGDDPTAPKYIETVIGAGYRFVASVSEFESPPQAESHPLEELHDELPDDDPPLLTAQESAAPIAEASPTRRRRWPLLVLGSAILILVPILYVWLRPQPSPPVSQPDLELSRVTDSGDIKFADISPDGNYVAYVRETDGQQSIWLKQLATGRTLQLATIARLRCPGLAFSPDGTFVYFVQKQLLAAGGELYQVPFLGGNTTKILTGISGAPSISPDGRKIAFVRSTLVTHGEDSVVTASIDGSDQRVLTTYEAPGIHFNRVTWTPDGKSLIYPLQSRLMLIPAEGGSPQPIPGAPWRNVDDVGKLPPGNDLIIVGVASGSYLPQLFELSVASGATHAITHDLSNYTSVRATANGRSLLAVQDLVLSSIQVLAPGAELQARSLTSENQNQDGIAGIAWTPDGKVVYTSNSEHRSGLIEVGSDGSKSRRVADVDAGAAEFAVPAVSPRGDFVAVARWSHEDAANLWRIDMAGGVPKRLTTGTQDFPPSITQDGKWIVYGSVQGDESVLMKVSSDGGPAVRLTDYSADSPAVSPDGKWIACSYNPQQSQPPRLAILPIAGGRPVKIFQLPETAAPPPLAWTPDGHAVSFIDSRNGVGNIWQQALAGGPPTAITHFASGKIFNFAWSRDGRLALSRGAETIDAVLIDNFRQVVR